MYNIFITYWSKMDVLQGKIPLQTFMFIFLLVYSYVSEISKYFMFSKNTSFVVVMLFPSPPLADMSYNLRSVFYTLPNSSSISKS